MAKIEINKFEASQRQIDAAIRMLFSNEDPVAIHTLAMASFQVLQDLAAKRSDCSIDKMTKSIIKPGKEKELRKILHSLSNFLKHADRDPEAVINNVDEEANDFVLLFSCFYYRDLGQQLTSEMTTLLSWSYIWHPDLQTIIVPPVFNSIISQVRTELTNMTRKEKLEVGKIMLGNSYNSI
ncbi:MAG: hypothetical protein HYV59_07805 [Planctomycetes bacterium]|nr:hypothetical protein [Planctomycetota bacterium]